MQPDMHPSALDTSVIDLLEADPRPSFIVALAPHPPTLVYTNPACAAYPALLDLITAQEDHCAPLWEWITGGASSPANGPRPAAAQSFSYQNVYWTRSVVHEEMVVVGANEQNPALQSPRKVRLDVAEAQPAANITPPKRIMPVETDAAAPVATEAPVSSLPAPEAEPQPPKPALSSPSASSKDSKEKPLLARSETVQSLGRTMSDPGWILPDTTTPGMYVACGAFCGSGY